jgi:Tfp pilus assembly protein PilV
MNSRGFAMTEALVALAVFGLAVTGGLGLALGGLSDTLEARRAQQAAAAAADLAGRIAALEGVDWTALPAAAPCALACTPPQLAALELADWRRDLGRALPAASASLEAGHAGTLVLRLEWDESGGERRALQIGIAR